MPPAAPTRGQGLWQRSTAACSAGAPAGYLSMGEKLQGGKAAFYLWREGDSAVAPLIFKQWLLG